MAAPRLFIDASVFIAAAASPTGGSAAVLELGRRGRVRLLASKQVLLEAEHNIRRKLPSEALLRFYQYLGTLPLRIVAAATAEEIAQAAEVVAEKDAHVLAAALKARADALLTLDRKHLLAPAVRAASATAIQTPGEFLQGFAT
jgi:predicted nucleic acid-binding protein